MFIVDAQQNIAFNAQQLGLDYTRWAWHQRDSQTQATAPPALTSLRDNMLARVAIVFRQHAGPLGVGAGASLLAELTPTAQLPTPSNWRSGSWDYYRRLADDHDQIRLILTRDDLDQVRQSWRDETEIDQRIQGLVVKMKGAEPISEPKQLEEWLEYGIRIIAPAWRQTRYAASARADGGLTLLGYDLLDAMAGFNILLDISAMSEPAAADALDAYDGAIIASHSNPRHFHDDPRCLSNDQIRRIAERDGVIGIMVYNRFLRRDWHPHDRKRQVTVSHWVDAVDYVCQLTGSVAHVGLGSDIDGGYPYHALPAEIDTSSDLWLLNRALRDGGFSQTEAAAILGGNMLRKLEESLPDG